LSTALLDRLRLTQALQLAEQAIGLSDPNPRVGCVIGLESGVVLGQGHTQHAGGPHAEAVALLQARAAGHTLAGATAWVTLEPCAHHGRTPPCADALVEAGVRRVVVAVPDPFPQVAGAGIARLRAAGVQVDAGPPDIAEQAWMLNIGFFSRVLRGRPWIRLKVASSLDGRTALNNGASQWITGPEARIDGHAWRRRAGAVLTGVGTVLADDPRLDVRLVPSARQPQRLVLDSRLRTPLHAQVLAAPSQACLITREDNLVSDAARRLTEQGVEVLGLPSKAGRIDLQALGPAMGQRGINELHVEAGAELNAALLAEAGAVDEIVAYVAPCVLGEGRGWTHGLAVESLSSAVSLEFLDAQRFGADLRLRLLTAAGAELKVPKNVGQLYISTATDSRGGRSSP